jgi:isoquinoline 1-oxidoreductase beta subunit
MRQVKIPLLFGWRCSVKIHALHMFCYSLLNALNGAVNIQGLRRGALTFWTGSYAAVVVDVSMQDGQPKVHRVTGVVDCGIVVNPDIVIQQSQGATNFGLSAALSGNITIKQRKVMESNFHDYTVLRMADAPTIDITIVPSKEAPTGIGEVFCPPVAPAVGNAVFKLTGKRVRTLPFSKALA